MGFKIRPFRVEATKEKLKSPCSIEVSSLPKKKLKSVLQQKATSFRNTVTVIKIQDKNLYFFTYLFLTVGQIFKKQSNENDDIGTERRYLFSI